MTRRNAPNPNQLGFDDLLAQAETDNRMRAEREARAHLPGTMDEALPYFRHG
jgi:hypothetical protein